MAKWSIHCTSDLTWGWGLLRLRKQPAFFDDWRTTAEMILWIYLTIFHNNLKRPLLVARPFWGGYRGYPWSQFQNLPFRLLRRMPCHCWYFTIVIACTFLYRSHNLSPSLSFLAISAALCHHFSWSCCLSEFYPYTQGLICGLRINLFL